MNQYIHLIEEISLNAWPAWKTELYDGWIIRFSKHYTHRTNCVNIIVPSTISISEKLDYCEREYSNAGTPTVFKISPTITPDIDEILKLRGYHIERKTDVLSMPLTKFNPWLNSPSSDYQVTLSNTITDSWIHNLFQLNETTNSDHLKIVPSMFKAIPRETIVAKIEFNGKMIASGLGILERDHVGLYAIYVDANHRNQNLGKLVCSEIIQQALKKGYAHAYLQVVTDNEIAKHLYQGLGFEYLYSYWFRSKTGQ